MAISKYVDPDLMPGLARLKALVGEGLDVAKDLAASRESSNARDETLVGALHIPQTVHQDSLTCPAGEGHPSVDMRVMHPRDASGPRPLFYWMHGGGYVLGTAKQGDLFTLMAAEHLGCFAASVDYRLAPEAAYPEPLEDCYRGLKYLLDHADDFNIDPTRVIIGGVSAGGGLAAGLGLLVRDRAAFSLLGQVLLYPMLDDRNVAPASEAVADTLVWSRKANAFGWQSYLGAAYGSDEVPIYAAPARAQDLSGLPPTYLPVGDLDLFLQENLDYAQKLTRAGVPTHFHIYPGAFHGFNGFAAEAPVSQNCNAEILSFMGKLLSEANQ